MCKRSMLPPPLGCNSPPVIGLLNLADGGSTLFRNVGNYLPVDKEHMILQETQVFAAVKTSNLVKVQLPSIL